MAGDARAARDGTQRYAVSIGATRMDGYKRQIAHTALVLIDMHSEAEAIGTAALLTEQEWPDWDGLPPAVVLIPDMEERP